MGISFADIVDKSKDLRVEFGGGALNLSYDPSALSPAKISKMNKELRKAEQDADAEDEDASLMGVAKMFCGIVKSWDLTGPLGEDEDGNPLVAEGVAVPVEPEYVAWLPSPVISHIVEKIGEDAAPKGKKRR